MKRGMPVRPGYTILEILLASVIAMLLLAAMYAALDVTLLRMEVNREQIARNDLSRAVINRLSTDIMNTLGPLPPKSGGDGVSGGSDGTSTSGTGTTASTGSTSSTTTSTSGTTSTASTGTASTGSTTSSSMGATTETTTTDSPVVLGTNTPFASGVVGTDKQVTIFLSRIPTSLVDAEAAANVDVTLPADMRRVTYYLSSTGTGLCRQERPWVTADGIWNATDPDRTDEASDMIAPEVMDVTFEYYDGVAWQTAWDGSQTAADGVSLTGPPRSLRITLTVQYTSRGTIMQRQVRHTFPIRSAVGLYVPPTSDTTTTTSTTGGM